MGKRQAQEAPPSGSKSAKKPKVTDVEEEQRKAREYVQNMLAQEAADREALARAKATPAKTPKGKGKAPTPVLPSPPLAAPVLLSSPKTNTMKGIKPKTPAPTPAPKSASKGNTSTKKVTAKELQQVHAEAERYMAEHEDPVHVVKVEKIKPVPAQRPALERRYTEDSDIVSTVSSQSMAISAISNYSNNGVLLNLFQVLVMCLVCGVCIQYKPENVFHLLVALAVAVLLWVLYKLWNINFNEDNYSIEPLPPRQYQAKGKKRN